MGSFNLTGSFSNLPIRSGDECYAILCGVEDKRYFNTSGDLTILSLPLKVVYDDYGSFYEEFDDSSLYPLFLSKHFQKNIPDIIQMFRDAMAGTGKIDEKFMFNNLSPFIIIEHRFFIEQLGKLGEPTCWSPFPFYWDHGNYYCDVDSDDFKLFSSVRAAIHMFDILPSASHYGGQFDNLMPLRSLYQSVVNFLNVDGYRESDKWSD